jgi:hypothetical protein
METYMQRKDQVDVRELIKSFDAATNEFLDLISSASEQEINTIPFSGSWTAAQLCEHVTKSNWSVAQALNAGGYKVDRDIAKRESELKEIFLNFSKKINSPEFILPTKDEYLKEEVFAELKDSILQIRKASEVQDLSEAVKHRVFGEITKLELLYFVNYHIQRHLRQLKNILKR